MDITWHYNSGGGPVGPKNKDDLLHLFKTGIINHDTLIWTDSFGATWKKYSDVAEFRTSGSPPPLPVAEVNDFWVWVLAVVPILGYLFEKAVSLNYGELSTAAIVGGYIVANGLFSYLDEQEIKRSGRKDLAGGFMLAVILLPFFLFLRSKKLRKNQLPLAVWLAATAFSMYASAGFTTPYIGVGMPSCDSGASVSKVKELFLQIPLNTSKLSAADVSGISTAKSTDKMRTCKAQVDTANGVKVPVTYTIEDRPDGMYYYELTLG